MDPGDHDRMLARTSHLPHVVAAALANAIGRDRIEQVAPCCGAGFYDSTRIASGTVEMWHDILQTNTPAILEELQVFKRELRELYGDLQAGRFADAAKFLARAQKSRNGLVEALNRSKSTGK